MASRDEPTENGIGAANDDGAAPSETFGRLQESVDTLEYEELLDDPEYVAFLDSFGFLDRDQDGVELTDVSSSCGWPDERIIGGLTDETTDDGSEKRPFEDDTERSPLVQCSFEELFEDDEQPLDRIGGQPKRTETPDEGKSKPDYTDVDFDREVPEES